MSVKQLFVYAFQRTQQLISHMQKGLFLAPKCLKSTPPTSSDACATLKNIISRFFFFTKRFGGRFISWWGEGEILFRFVYVPGTCTTIKSLFPFIFLQTFKRQWRVNFFKGEGDSRVHSNFFRGEGGGGQSRDQGPESRVYSPGSRVHYSLICCPNCDRKILESCHWDAKKLGKNCQKSKKWLLKFQKLLPNFLHIFIQYILKQCIVFFARSN